jgi:DNA-binding transcriptional LysR family regulator
MMSNPSLEAFVVLATELHFARSADQLHMAPPTVSELIRRLEIELGTPLFVRTTRRVAITPAGAEFLPRARSILEELKAARSAVRQVARGESGLCNSVLRRRLGRYSRPI